MHLRADRRRDMRSSGGYAAPPAALPEKYVRCLWYDGKKFLKRGIRTRDGRLIRVVSPGRWNTGRGPDFLDGVFRIGLRGTVCGDVEVHRRRHDWHMHAHRRNPFFGGVRLHVFLLDDGGGRCVNYSGDAMTEICLRGQTRRGLEAAARLIDPRRYPYHAGTARGRCGAVARGGERLAEFLRKAGEARLREKAARARWLAQHHGQEQALYRLILETLGYAAHKDAFIRLAELLPWRALGRVVHRVSAVHRRGVVESVLMGAAGLIPAAPQPEWDAESVCAWEQASRTWATIKGACDAGELPCGVWNRAAQRPASSPCRRIAGISPLLAACAGNSLGSLLAGVEVGTESGLLEERLAGLLDEGAPSYWRTHCRWGGTKLRTPLALIGREHRLKIVVNVLLPILYAEGRRVAAIGLLREIPAVEPDSRVKTMMSRLVGHGAPFPRRWGMAAQQGMLHIHRRFCAKDRSGCARCRLPGILAQFRNEGAYAGPPSRAGVTRFSMSRERRQMRTKC